MAKSNFNGEKASRLISEVPASLAKDIRVICAKLDLPIGVVIKLALREVLSLDVTNEKLGLEPRYDIPEDIPNVKAWLDTKLED